MKKNKWVPLLGIAALLSVNGACCKSKSPRIDVKKYTESAARQTAGLYDKLMATGERKSPQNFQNGVNRYCAYEGWISGFFPGSLWFLYELTGDPQWKTRASEQTERLERIKNLTSDHDIGFRMGCSYGNGYRITGDPAYRDVLIQSARSLATRFQPEAGVIMSWNPNKRWKCPVIIDNMMNLELLFNAAIYSGDSSFYKIAVSHADKTLENHYRADHSSFHVVDYDPQTGAVRMKNTAQGYADGSAWARGQAMGTVRIRDLLPVHRKRTLFTAGRSDCRLYSESSAPAGRHDPLLGFRRSEHSGRTARRFGRSHRRFGSVRTRFVQRPEVCRRGRPDAGFALIGQLYGPCRGKRKFYPDAFGG